ncbi:AMP-dependent ligase [Candidatus Gastranaerophilus sp. (ex Termes propinquus)]|nr:AMP-dependent ligase [Candidatus Gastranaerophilus sp. (ex Termes propinquus)]
MLKIFKKFNTKEYENDTALVYKQKNYTYKALAQLVFAQHIKLKNIECKSVAIASEDSFDFIINFLSSIYSGKEIFLPDDINKLKKLQTGCFVVTETPKEAALAAGRNVLPEISADDVVINFFTSGTTSEPKLIKKTLSNLVIEACDIIEEFNLSRHGELVFSSTARLSHLFGLTFHLMVPLCGGFVVNADRINYPEQAESLAQNTFFISTPSFLEKIYKHNIIMQTSPKFVLSSGSKLSDEIFSYLENFSHTTEVYGSTETGVIAYRKSAKSHFLKKFKNVETRQDKAGRLVVRSCYFPEDELTTSDVVAFEDSEHFSIIDRSDRILKIQEKRVSATEIEQALKRHCFVENAHCLKIDEKLACAVVLSDSGKGHFLNAGNLETIKVLKNSLKDTSEILPQRWRFLGEIPENARGKVDREKIEKIFLTKLSYPLVLKHTQDAKSAEIELVFYKNSNFFKGHFDDYPLTPGVVQLFFAHWFAQSCFEVKISSEQVKKIKFSNPIKPDKVIRLYLIDEDKTVSWEYFDKKSGDKFSSGIFTKNKGGGLV